MRTSTKFLNASLALSATIFATNHALSLQLAQNQDALAPLPEVQTSATESPNASPSASASSEPTPSQTQGSAGKPTAKPTQAPKPTVQTLVSDAISYKYGQIQLELTKTDGSISDIQVLIGDASYGRDAAYAALVQATLQTQGTNYGNVSGATFTTEAFKQAVQNALAKG